MSNSAHASNPHDLLLWTDGFWCFRDEFNDKFLREKNYRVIAPNSEEWIIHARYRPLAKLRTYKGIDIKAYGQPSGDLFAPTVVLTRHNVVSVKEFKQSMPVAAVATAYEAEGLAMHYGRDLVDGIVKGFSRSSVN